MKTLIKLSISLFGLLYCLDSGAVTVTIHYDNFATKKFAGVKENIVYVKDTRGKKDGIKTVELVATGKGDKKCVTNARIRALRTGKLNRAEVDIISYLQKMAETEMENGKICGFYREQFTVIKNGGLLPTKGYYVNWKKNMDGSADIIISDHPVNMNTDATASR
jgi:hypothetical protein